MSDNLSELMKNLMEHTDQRKLRQSLPQLMQLLSNPPGQELVRKIKQADPDTEVTLHYIRALIRAEAVPVVCCGRKKLVNVDAVMELLANGYAIPPEPQQIGVIRRVV